MAQPTGPVVKTTSAAVAGRRPPGPAWQARGVDGRGPSPLAGGWRPPWSWDLV